jgi:hypothetical protein
MQRIEHPVVLVNRPYVRRDSASDVALRTNYRYNYRSGVRTGRDLLPYEDISPTRKRQMRVRMLADFSLKKLVNGFSNAVRRLKLG